MIFLAYVLFQKFFHNYINRVDAEFAVIDIENQASALTDYLIKSSIVATISVILAQLRNLVVRYYEARIGINIVNETLSKVLIAPVNLFFDVTPIGRILKIFQEEINIFRGGLFGPLKFCVEMASHVIVVMSLMFTINARQTIAGIAFIAFVFSRIIPPFFRADDQLRSVHMSLWVPIESYFYECMRGTSIIRAFGQEQSIMDKQHKLLDKTTT